MIILKLAAIARADTLELLNIFIIIFYGLSLTINFVLFNKCYHKNSLTLFAFSVANKIIYEYTVVKTMRVMNG